MPIGAESGLPSEVLPKLYVKHKMSGYFDKSLRDKVFRIAVLFLESYHEVRHFEADCIHPKGAPIRCIYPFGICR